MTTEEHEDKINSTPEVSRVLVAEKRVSEEIIYRYVIVYGNDELGYIASHEEWFKADGKNKIEFYEVLFQTPIYSTAAESLADAMPSAEKEASNIGEWQESQVEEESLPDINPSEYEFDDGYVGALGHTFTTATHATFMETVEAAAQFNGIDTNDVIDMLIDGKAVKWQQSPNYYYDHSHGVIRKKRIAQPVKVVRCACGHSVEHYLVMNASRGSSCPDCYDRMSD